MIKQKLETDGIILFFILLSGTILRLINIQNIPYMYDEFSALFRTEFNTFGELIRNGVMVDGHPAGVQVFLYYWTRLFGMNEIVVKLPFILLGIASILLVYLIGKKWFNSTVALLSASCFATLQYPVMYSLIARPYIAGLFFTLLMVYFWSKIIKTEGKIPYKTFAGFVVAAAISCYSHHFSLLFVAIVGISGLFLLPRNLLLKYLLALLAIVVLYAPHLPIFFHQLGMGGIEGWLAKPENDFILEYIKYIFHFSPFLYSLIAFYIVASVLICIDRRQNPWKNKMLLLSVIWFLLPLVIGFVYSKYVNAVIQYSVLIFSFPYFIFIVFSHFPSFTKAYRIAAVSILCLTTILTLLIEREHYTTFYQSPFEEIITNASNFADTSAAGVIIIDSRKDISEYYLKKNNQHFDFVSFDEFKGKADFISFLSNQGSKNLAYACLSDADPVVRQLIMEQYPFLIRKKDYFTGNFYVFSKQSNGTDKIKELFSSCNTFDQHPYGWKNDDPLQHVDSIFYSSAPSFLLEKNNEWGPSFSYPLNEIIYHSNNLIDISLALYCTDNNTDDLLLVSSIETNSEVIDWRSVSIKEYQQETHEWFRAYQTIKLSDIHLGYSDLVLKIYIWNKGKANCYIDDFSIRVHQGNPRIYGLYNKI